MKEKLKNCSKAIQYSIAFFLVAIFIFLIFLATDYGMRTERFLCFTDTSSNSFLDFHVSVLEFCFHYYPYLLLGLFLLVCVFELKYKFKNKTVVRITGLSIFVLLLNLFTITYLFGIVDLMYSATHSPKIEKIMEEKKEIPNKENVADQAPPEQQI